jgi:hypothetical protein
MTPQKPDLSFGDAILAVVLPYLTLPAKFGLAAVSGGPLSGNGELPVSEEPGKTNC